MDNDDILKAIETENFIWIIYLFIIGISFLANGFEKEFYINDDLDAKNKYRVINIFVFSLALIIYFYFFYENYKTISKLSHNNTYEEVLFNNLNFIASLLVLIAGSIFLYIAIYDKNLDTEISFN